MPEARDPKPNKPPGEVALDNARRKASGVGLLAMKDQLQQMAAAPAAVQLNQDVTPGPGVGAGMRKEDKDLKAKMDAAIKKLYASGEFDTLQKQYFKIDVKAK